MLEYLALYVVKEKVIGSWEQMFEDIWTRRIYFKAETFEEVRDQAREFRHLIDHPSGLVSPATILEKIGEKENKPFYRVVQTGVMLANDDMNHPNFSNLQIEPPTV